MMQESRYVITHFHTMCVMIMKLKGRCFGSIGWLIPNYCTLHIVRTKISYCSKETILYREDYRNPCFSIDNAIKGKTGSFRFYFMMRQSFQRSQIWGLLLLLVLILLSAWLADRYVAPGTHTTIFTHNIAPMLIFETGLFENAFH